MARIMLILAVAVACQLVLTQGGVLRVVGPNSGEGLLPDGLFGNLIQMQNGNGNRQFGQEHIPCARHAESESPVGVLVIEGRGNVGGEHLVDMMQKFFKIMGLLNKFTPKRQGVTLVQAEAEMSHHNVHDRNSRDMFLGGSPDPITPSCEQVIVSKRTHIETHQATAKSVSVEVNIPTAA